MDGVTIFMRRAFPGLVALSLAFAGGGDASACGLVPHVGPTGLIQDCGGDHRRPVGPWRVALQGGALRSELHAPEGEIGVDQLSLSARVEYRLGFRLGLGLAVRRSSCRSADAIARGRGAALR